MKILALRWLTFNAVGAGGIAVQFFFLALFKSGLHLQYLVACGIARDARASRRGDLSR